MAEPKQVKVIKGGLNIAKRLLDDGEGAGLTASQRAEAGRKAAELIKSQEQVKASEALGQLMEKGFKRTTTTQADRTRVGGGNIGGAPFPAISEADPAYKGKVWGVMDEGTAARLKNLTTDDTAWTTMLGSANQLKTNPIVFDKLKRGFIDSMKQGNLSPELAGKINHNLALTFGEGADIRDPKIWRQADTFEKRAALADVMMGQGTAPSKGGIAIGGEKSGKGVIFKPTDILKRETEPSLLHTEHGGDVPTFAAGPRLFRLNKESVYDPSLHPGFPTLLTGEDLKINMKPTPTEVYLRDWHAKFKKDNPERKSPGYYDLALGVKGEGLPSQELNDEYIRHLLREGFKKGGKVDIQASDRRLAQAIEKRMAKGGKVDIAASDARLQAAIDARMGMASGGKIVKGITKGFKKLFADDKPAVTKPSSKEANEVARQRAALPKDKGGLGLPANNTAEQRAQAMGYDKDVYHGTNEDFTSFKGDQPIFATEDPEIAKLYGKNIYPLKTRGEEMTVSDLTDEGHGHFAENLAKELGLFDEADQFKNSDNRERELINALKERGIDRLKITDMSDMGGVQTQHALPAGSDNVRSRNAAFDPFRRSAAVATSMGVAAPDLMAEEVDKAEGGGAFKKLEFMADGGKLVKGLGKIGKKLMAEEQVASDAIGKAAKSAGMNAPVTANKPLTGIQDFHTSLMDSVRARAMDAQKQMDSWDYKYAPGQYVFTEHGAKNNLPPLKILEKSRSGWNIVREDPNDLMSKKVIDPETGRAKRTPYEPGYRVRREISPEEWSEFVIPESAIKGDVELARGGIAYMDKGGKAGKLASGIANVGKRLMADAPVESQTAKTGKRLLLGEILPAAEREENLRKMLEPSKIKERLYHATPEDIKFFKPGGLNPKVSGEAIWLSNDPKRTPAAHNIGSYDNPRQGVNVMPVHVQAKNPMILDDETMLKWAQEVYGEGSREFPMLMPKKWREEVMKDYDSIVLADPYKRGDSHEIIMFEPEKIKSAIGNRGTYNTDTADITKARGGLAMADGGKLVKGLGKISKKLLANEAPKATAPAVPKTLSAGDVVNGMLVRKDIPNQSSIGASLYDYSTHGVQEVPMSAFETVGKPKYRTVQEEQYTKELARQIQENKELNPLIVVKDAQGHYILEGAHRFDALRELGIESFPALMVHDLESLADVAVPAVKKAEGGGAFKKLEFNQHFDGGGIAIPEMNNSFEGSRREPLLTEKDWANIKRNAPEVYEWAKQNVKDEASQLKSARGVKDFALRTGAQYLGGIPDLINLGLMGVDALADTNLSSEKPWFGSEQYIDALKRSGAVGENEFPIAETIAGVLAPAGLIKKGVKKIGGMKPAKEAPKKRRGGLTAMSR